MAPPTLDSSLKDAKIAGAFISRGGFAAVVFALSIVIIFLGSLLVWQQLRFNDRWTGTDHRNYVVEHDKRIDFLVNQARSARAENMAELKGMLEATRQDVESIARGQARLEGIQEQILRRLEENK
jgi:hypothetical protein